MTKTVQRHDCQCGGYLVSKADFLPKHPAEYNAGFIGQFVGCNHLRCNQCGHDVHEFTGWAITDRREVVFTELLRPELWSQLHWMTEAADANTRTYFCKCGQWAVEGLVQLDPLDPISFEHGFPFHWRCAGHPLITADDVIGGIVFSEILKNSDAALPLLLGELTLDDSPQIPAFPGVDVRRIYALIAGTGNEENFSRSVAGHLLHPSPQVRRQVIEFFHHFPQTAGADALVHAIIDQPELFTDVHDVAGKKATLSEHLWVAVERAVSVGQGGAALQYLRNRLLAGTDRYQTFVSVAMHDWDWIEQNCSEVLQASPALVGYYLVQIKGFPVEMIKQRLQRILRIDVISLPGLTAKCDRLWQQGTKKHDEIFAAMGWG